MFSKKEWEGFVLVEVVIALFLLGVMFQGGVLMMKILRHQRQFHETQQKGETLLKALAFYAAEKGRLPWPSPLETNSPDFGKEEASFSLKQGIVPFKTLGIPESDTKDGFGRPFFYIVASTKPAAFSIGPIETYCRAHPVQPLLHPDYAFEGRHDFIMVAICSSLPDHSIFPLEETGQGILLPRALPRGSLCLWATKSLLMARYGGISCAPFMTPSSQGVTNQTSVVRVYGK